MGVHAFIGAYVIMVVRFGVASATTGTTTQPYALPKAFRPSAALYVKADMCNATGERLYTDTTAS